MFESNFLEGDDFNASQTYKSRKISFYQPPSMTTMKMEMNKERINPKDLVIIKQIGSGSFGTVYLR